MSLRCHARFSRLPRPEPGWRRPGSITQLLWRDDAQRLLADPINERKLGVDELAVE